MDHGTGSNLANLPNDSNVGGPLSQTLSIIENGANYDFTYTVGSVANTVSFSKASIGTLDSVGIRFQSTVASNSTATFGELSVVQVPEPGTLSLLALGTLSLLAYRRLQATRRFRE